MDLAVAHADSADTWIAEAEAAAQQGRVLEAKSLYERALQDLRAAPGRRLVRALGGLSWVLVASGAPQAALDAADEALAAQAGIAPEDHGAGAILHGLAGNALMALHRYPLAQQAYARARLAQEAAGASGLARAETRSLLGEAAFRQNDIGVAVRHQRACIEALRGAGDEGRARLAPALASFGVSLFHLGQPREAESALREALAIDPTLLLAAENLIHVLYKQDRIEEGKALATEKYRRQSFSIKPPPAGARGTLLLLWSLDGTVPHRYLLDGAPFGLIDWHIAYADAPQEARLPPYDLVLNLIGDVDEGEDALRAAIAFQARSKAPVLNDPARIAKTARHDVAALLSGVAGLVVPKTVQMQASLLQRPDRIHVLQSHGLAHPVLLRSAGKHGGESVELIETPEALDQALAAIPDDAQLYVTAYYDYRSDDGHFRKYRAIFVNRKPYPYHLAISPRWLVHYFSADMLDHPHKRAEELAYLQDMAGCLGAQALRTLSDIGARMDLDYCGIDFSRLPDGRILLFECNATMLVHTEPENSVLAAKNLYIRKIIGAFQDHLVASLRT